MIMMIVPNSLVCHNKEAQREEEEEEAGGRRKAESTGNPTPGRSHRSNSVRGVECEEQEKLWMVVSRAYPGFLPGGGEL